MSSGNVVWGTIKLLLKAHLQAGDVDGLQFDLWSRSVR